MPEAEIAAPDFGAQLAFAMTERPGTVAARLNVVLRLTVLLVTLLIARVPGAAAAAGDQQQPSGPKATASDEPVSAGRISEGLRRSELELPPIPAVPPTFRTEVIGRLETPLDVIRRELQEEAGVRWKPRGPQTTTAWGSSVATVDVLPALVGLVNKIKDIRRQHAEADARRMVQRELDAFCMTHDCSDIERDPATEGVIVPSPSRQP
jgi:hypothetical protein